jgi:hypothetical protein
LQVTAWADDDLYVSETTREDAKGFKATFYVLGLKTGEVIPLSWTLDGHVRKMLIGADHRLYMCVRNIFEYGNDKLDNYESFKYPSGFFHLQFCRVSLK